MNAGRLLGFGLVGTVTLLAACQPTPTPNDSASSSTGQVSSPTGTKPGLASAANPSSSTGPRAAGGDSQEALVAKQTEAYAAQMEALLEQRRVSNAANANKPHPGQGNTASDTQATGNSQAAPIQPNPAPIPSQVSWSAPGQTPVDPISPNGPSANPTSLPPDNSQANSGDRSMSPRSSMGSANPNNAAIPPAAQANVPTSIGQGAIPARANIDPTPDDALMAKLLREVRQDPANPTSQLNLQLYKYLSEDQAPNVATLQSLSPEDREIVLAIMDSLGNFRNGIRADRRMLTNQKIRPLMELSDRLRSQADLSIPTLALCRVVRGYGDYDEMDTRFVAGKAQQTVVYCEVANFASQFTDKQSWQTSLTQEIALYTESGMAVMLDKSPKTSTDHCRQRRHDFYIPRLLTLPPNLSIGRYYLKVTVVDQQANRVAESSLPIDIVAE